MMRGHGVATVKSSAAMALNKQEAFGTRNLFGIIVEIVSYEVRFKCKTIHIER
jgi:hypothetical protein